MFFFLIVMPTICNIDTKHFNQGPITLLYVNYIHIYAYEQCVLALASQYGNHIYIYIADVVL